MKQVNIEVHRKYNFIRDVVITKIYHHSTTESWNQVYTVSNIRKQMLIELHEGIESSCIT